MILRDSYGEVTVPFGQLFTYQEATLEVVCPDASAMDRFGQRAICVRLLNGIVIHDGRRFEMDENGKKPMFLFSGELVANRVRVQLAVDAGVERRLAPEPAIPADKPVAPLQQRHPKNQSKNPRKRAESDQQPTTENMFD